MTRLTKNNCYKCKHRRELAYSAHSACTHPITKNNGPLVYAILATMGQYPLGITANQHGVDNGWFCWPLNFDPVWLETCNGFEEKGQK